MLIDNRIWRDSSGRRTYLEDLTNDHLDNIISYLSRKVKSLRGKISNTTDYASLKAYDEELAEKKKWLNIMSREKDKRESINSSVNERRREMCNKLYSIGYSYSYISGLTDRELEKLYHREVY